MDFGGFCVRVPSGCQYSIEAGSTTQGLPEPLSLRGSTLGSDTSPVETFTSPDQATSPVEHQDSDWSVESNVETVATDELCYECQAGRSSRITWSIDRKGPITQRCSDIWAPVSNKDESG